MNKTKIYVLVLMVGAGLIVGALIFRNKGPGDEAAPVQDAKVETENKDVVTDKNSNSLEGVLRVSDDKKLGNFKLVSDNGEIYIRTSRDFSKLVGLQVLALISGTFDNFQLIDIQPAVQKDGFIISQ